MSAGPGIHPHAEAHNWWRDDWPHPVDVARAIARGETTARLNRQQTIALLIVLGMLDRERTKRLTRARLQEDLEAAHADRKQARRDREEMRQDRDQWRKRALAAEARQGRAGCGKVPVRSAIEARQFIDLVCSNTGEQPDEYMVYRCQLCEPIRGGAPYHIGHVIPRHERDEDEPEQPASLTSRIEVPDRVKLTIGE